MDTRNFDANPLPPAARRLLAVAAGTTSVLALVLACSTAGPGNWVPPSVREVAAGRPVTELPRVVVTGRRLQGAASSPAADAAQALVCEDGSLPVAQMTGPGFDGNLRP